VPEADLWETFNLGVGFCLVVPEAAATGVLAACTAAGHQAWELGQVAAGSGGGGGRPLAGLPY
jgi:phosphoribosylformylglycinamidine cyclo-ligase